LGGGVARSDGPDRHARSELPGYHRVSNAAAGEEYISVRHSGQAFSPIDLRRDSSSRTQWTDTALLRGISAQSVVVGSQLASRGCPGWRGEPGTPPRIDVGEHKCDSRPGDRFFGSHHPLSRSGIAQRPNGIGWRPSCDVGRGPGSTIASGSRFG
jgi:hypothetical protein